MEVIVAKRAGFCFGVKRAIDIATEVSERKQGVFTLGPIIHNPQVIEKLGEEGVRMADIGSLGKEDIKTLIIRTHGIPRELYDKIQALGCEIIDATCPFVKKAQEYSETLRDENYQVLILGDADHPEVQGILSYAGEDAIVVDGKSPLPHVKPRVGIVVQTTQPVDSLKKLLSQIIDRVKELKVYNTICSSTALRLRETAELASKVDVMIVAGGKNSANTTQLTQLCTSLKVKTYHVETAEEIRDSWFEGATRVGITAGASTPRWIISEVEKRIRRYRGGES